MDMDAKEKSIRTRAAQKILDDYTWRVESVDVEQQLNAHIQNIQNRQNSVNVSDDNRTNALNRAGRGGTRRRTRRVPQQ